MTEQEKRIRDQMMRAEQMRQQATGGGTDVVLDQQARQQQAPAQITGAQQAAISEAQNAATPGMGELMKTKTPTWGTALAKTLAAGYLGVKGGKKRKEEVKLLKKAYEKDAELTDSETQRVRSVEDEVLGFKRSKAQREETEFGERNIQDEEWLYRATTDKKKGDKGYASGFAQFLKDQDTRYGSLGRGGRAAAAIQELDRWKIENPDATQEEIQNKFDDLLASHKTTDVAGVDYSVGTGKPVIDDMTPDVIRDTIVQQERDVHEGRKEGELSAQSFAMAQEKLNLMETEIGTLQLLIENEDFDGAVGLLDNITGRISENFAYFGDEGKLGKQVELVVNNMVLKQASFLKGNLNVQELNLLMGSVPSRATDEDGWKAWFKEYKRLYEKAKASALKKQSRGQAMFSQEDDSDIIYID